MDHESSIPNLPVRAEEEIHLASRSHRLTHILFIAGIVIKGAFGLLDTIVGIFFFSTSAITSFIAFLTQHELGEDPTDFFANKLIEILPSISVHTQQFVAWYFLIHGVLNVILVIGLLRKKLWAYPVYGGVFLLFIGYQVYRFTHTHSPLLLLVTFFDMVVITLVWKEYQFMRRTRGHHPM